MRNHYVPQFLLRRFSGASGLWQFDTHKGNFERRSAQNAAQLRRFYTDELEIGILQRIDGQAADIIAKGLIGRNRDILITTVNRTVLARWLALFMIRTPQTLKQFRAFCDDSKGNESQAVAVIYEHREKVLAIARKKNPAKYDQYMQTVGQSLGEEVLLARFAMKIREGKINFTPVPEFVFTNHITEESVQKFAEPLCRLQWVWLESRHGFIIGDNPLCRWGSKGVWNYGIKRKDVEITIPLGEHLCLRLQRHQSRAKTSIDCSREQTFTYNMRQTLSSTRYVFGPERTLRPFAAKLVNTAISRGELQSRPEHAP